jgi:hypothetical protein
METEVNLRLIINIWVEKDQQIFFEIGNDFWYGLEEGQRTTATFPPQHNSKPQIQGGGGCCFFLNKFLAAHNNNLEAFSYIPHF